MGIVSPIALHQMCQLFCEASIKSDMAKRIMLSIIPAVQSEGEKHYTGGFDYKALRSAVNGARDLIKYGARACADEIKHAKATPMPGDDTQTEEALGPFEARIEELKRKQNKIRTLLKQEKYKQGLLLCKQLFEDPDIWSPHYGGEAWKKITNVLIDLVTKQYELENLRKTAVSSRRDQQVDYLAAEIAIMKEMIVIMNVFDGLAHNTASIMYNVVEEELKDLRYSNFNLKHPSSENQREYPAKYMQSIITLMDSKELDDPREVYEQVKDVVEQDENKHLFSDYIGKIKSVPLKENPEEKLKLIRLRKILKEHMVDVHMSMDRIASHKDVLINAKRSNAPSHAIRLIIENMRDLHATIVAIDNLIDEKFNPDQQKVNQKLIAINNKIMEILAILKRTNDMLLMMLHKYTSWNLATKDFDEQKEMPNISNVEAVSSINTLKQYIGQFDGVISEL
jgi:hypothetical protein